MELMMLISLDFQFYLIFLYQRSEFLIVLQLRVVEFETLFLALTKFAVSICFSLTPILKDITYKLL